MIVTISREYGASGMTVAHRVGDLLVVGTGDVDFLARQARLIDHYHARIGPKYGFDHRLRCCARNAANCVRLKVECISAEATVD